MGETTISPGCGFFPSIVPSIDFFWFGVIVSYDSMIIGTTQTRNASSRESSKLLKRFTGEKLSWLEHEAYSTLQIIGWSLKRKIDDLAVWSLKKYHLICLLSFKPRKHAFSWNWHFKNSNKMLDLKSTNTVSTPSTSSASWVFWGHEPTWSA